VSLKKYLLGFVCVALCVISARAQKADIVLKHGHIWTRDSAQPWVEAVAISGDKIIAVGSDATVAAMAGAQTQVIDLGGRMAMPGINDSLPATHSVLTMVAGKVAYRSPEMDAAK